MFIGFLTRKNWENWVGSEVTGVKITFLAIFDIHWTHILAPKGPDMEFHKHFSFQSIRKKETITNYVT